MIATRLRRHIWQRRYARELRKVYGLDRITAWLRARDLHDSLDDPSKHSPRELARSVPLV